MIAVDRKMVYKMKRRGELVVGLNLFSMVAVVAVEV